MTHYGIGALTAVTILAELGDCSQVLLLAPRGPLLRAWTSPCTSPISAARPGTSRARGRRRCGGRCSRPPRSPAERGSPDRDYYDQAAERLGGNRACLAVARKLLKRSYHTLRELGEEALAPA